jgi:hypothetical protein
MTRMHPITLLVLAQLTACPRPRGPLADPVTPNEPASMPLAVSPPAEDATPEATPTPTATTTPAEPKRCAGPADCPPRFECVRPFDGHRFMPGPGSCLPPGPRPGGRPLLVHGTARVSPRARTRAWLDGSRDALGLAERDAVALAERDALAKAAFDEHASVAAFARTICQLLALGAPAALVLRTQQALADEIRHAEQTFAWVSRLEAEPVGPGPLPEAAAPIDASPEAFLRDVFRGGCIGETLAAYEADARSRALAARHAELAAFYARIAADEAAHAALAYDTAAWLLTTFPELRSMLEEERADLLGRASAEEASLLGPLLAVLS